MKIETKNTLKIEDIGFDISAFAKERLYENAPNSYIYHDKNRGIAFEVREDLINWINYFPPKKASFVLCDNEEVKTFYLQESWFVGSKLEDRIYTAYCGVTNVVDIELDTAVVTATCENPFKKESCPVNPNKISVRTIAVDPDNDPLAYQYTVSGGKIVGEGAEVVWDLSGLKPGNYTITAAVDDGCGFCGAIKTKTIVIK